MNNQGGRYLLFVAFWQLEWASLLAGLETKLPTYVIFAPTKIAYLTNLF